MLHALALFCAREGGGMGDGARGGVRLIRLRGVSVCSNSGGNEKM
jgi:hypothetical protein